MTTANSISSHQNNSTTTRSDKHRLLADLLKEFGSDPSSHNRRRRPSSSSISSILLFTTERLHTETARANAAERQIADVMALFRSTHEQKVQLERDILRVREELCLYKVQLEVAQKEIFRAQEIVERIDRQRVQAEESAVRAREKSRKLAESRAVDLALEEGRRLGFEQGLNQGRLLRSKKESSGSSQATQVSRKSKSSARPKRRPTPEEPIPAPTPRTASSRPEDITIQDPPPRPISAAQIQSPAAPRRSIILPPDNYIPFLNADATITLPPPHELTIPVPTAEPATRPPPPPSFQIEKSTKGKSVQRSLTPPSPTPRREPPDPGRLIPMAGSDSHEPRSPATYPNRPALRRREIVMPVPLGLFNASTSTNHLRQAASTPTPPPRPKSLHAIRTSSHTTIPDIEIETPSTKTPSSGKTAYDPILLTPDQSVKPIALPSSHPQDDGDDPFYINNGKISAILPDNTFPPGFVPLSPILTDMANLTPYPPGFGPVDPPPTSRPDFVYPASPLARSQ